jgi:methylenetetrahydrofolate dehydrogenase (NADP+)/methenyltetrahydrofolate cyclohydrolase
MASLIDGKVIAAQVREEVKEAVEALKQKGVQPGLTVILVGDDPASHTYVRGKEKACQEVGIRSEVIKLPASISEEALLAEVRRCNEDPAVHGILVQLPLPSHIHEQVIIETIDPRKDVDGFHPVNVGLLTIGQKERAFVSCTPYGVMEMLKKTGIDPAGKKAVVIGRSNIVGKPMATLLVQANATVTICHSRTNDLAAELKNADIVVAAVGKPQMVKGGWLKKGAVVIDVGMNRLADKRLVGDVDFESASQVAGWITPVPGGVGPMTIAMLLKNTLQAAQLQS